MGLRFGKEEQLACIVDVPTTGPNGEALCLAYKTTTYWVGAGVWVSDDGYILQKKNDANAYFRIMEDTTGLPEPLPHYSIPLSTYMWGYSLWWAVGLTVLWGVGTSQFRKRNQKGFAARQEATPIDRGPPKLDTEGDRFIYEQVKPSLALGETVQHQAYVTEWDYANQKAGDAVYFVVLTTERLFVITTRPSAFGVLLENEGVASIRRADILSARVDHGAVLFVTTNDGAERGYAVAEQKKLSNQNAFLLNVSRLLPPG